MAAEKGYLGIIYTRTNPAMNLLGNPRRVIGSSPMGFAVKTETEDPIMLDICLAYASYGKFQEKADRGEQVPSYWGTDASGLPTTDPSAIKNGGCAAPIAGHKGLGLSMLTEILTGVLSGGQVIDEKQSYTSKGPGVYSQTAIVIKADGLMPAETFTARTTDVVKRMRAVSPGIHIPGETSFAKRRNMEKDGFVELSPAVAASVNDMLKQLGIDDTIE
jgi:LDH2 family malate/lactate/ureidoglycolate dehydrogenase